MDYMFSGDFIVFWTDLLAFSPTKHEVFSQTSECGCGRQRRKERGEGFKEQNGLFHGSEIQ